MNGFITYKAGQKEKAEKWAKKRAEKGGLWGLRTQMKCLCPTTTYLQDIQSAEGWKCPKRVFHYQRPQTLQPCKMRGNLVR